MKNSYDKAASSFVPDHLFGWAIDDEDVVGCEVARTVMKENVVRDRLVEKRNKREALVEKRLTGFAEIATDVLNNAGFNVDYDITESNDIVLTFDDVDGNSSPQRRQLGRKIVEKLTEAARGKVSKLEFPEHIAGGRIAVKLTNEAIESVSPADNQLSLFDEVDPEEDVDDDIADYYADDTMPGSFDELASLNKFLSDATRKWHEEYDPDDPVMTKYGQQAWNNQVNNAVSSLRDQLFELIDAVHVELHNGQFTTF